MKRIYLNLLYFYQDFRQKSKICVSDNIKTIRDLQEHIANIFDINSSFYLVSDDYYLPPAENIDLLDDNDLIYVMPDVQETQEKLKQKHDVALNLEEIEKCCSSPKAKKKNKSAKYKDEEIKIAQSFESEVIKELEEFTKKSKKNKRKKQKELVCDISDNKVTEKSVTQLGELQNMETSEINEQQIKTKTNELDTILNKNEQNSEKFEEKTRKRRRCISPIKVTEILPGEKPILSDEKINTTPKIIVHSIEIINNEDICDQSAKSSLNEVVKSRQNDKKVIAKPYKHSTGLGHIIKAISAESTAFQDNESLATTDTSILIENFVNKRRRTRTRRRKTKIPEGEYSNGRESVTEVERAVFRPPKSIAAPKSHIKFTHDENEVLNESNFTQNDSNFTENNSNFTENNSNFAGSLAESNLSPVHSTPKLKCVNNNENKDSLNGFSLKEKLSISNIDISTCSDLKMTEIPNINSVILFKKLTMGTDYQPRISNYILGKVYDVTENGQQLKLKIIDGHNELIEPMGRFSCILEEDEDITEKKDDSLLIGRLDLIEPKILK